MDSEEIICLLNSRRQVKEKFTGKVYSSDTIPDLKPGKFYIVNTLQSNSSFDLTGHWCIYLYYKKLNKLVFIDPYGDPPSLRFAIPMLKLHNNAKLCYSNFAFQNESNTKVTTCGMHCIAFAILFSYDLDINAIYFNFYKIQRPVSDYSYFDRLVTKFISVFFNETKRSIFHIP